MVRYFTSIYTWVRLGIWPKPAFGDFSPAFYLKKLVHKKTEKTVIDFLTKGCHAEDKPTWPKIFWIFAPKLVLIIWVFAPKFYHHAMLNNKDLNFYAKMSINWSIFRAKDFHYWKKYHIFEKDLNFRAKISRKNYNPSKWCINTSNTSKWFRILLRLKGEELRNKGLI